jgi:hypothetical protein
MTLDETLLQKLAKWRPTGRQTLEVAAADAAWRVSVSADRCDELGCLAWELTLRPTTAPAGPVAVRDWAERVAARATGLLEHLKVVEIDAPRGLAQLRSEEPARKGDDLFYYELLLGGNGNVSVRRFHAHRSPGTRREQVAFALTHEALAKLVRDLTAA